MLYPPEEKGATLFMGGAPMSEGRIRRIDRRIGRIKEALGKIGRMRPGSLTRQFRDPEERAGAYWQISYTRHMRSRTEYVRREWVAEPRRQIAAYKRFKRLVEEWVDLGIARAQQVMRMDKKKRSR
jgi:hypothetical protein